MPIIIYITNVNFPSIEWDILIEILVIYQKSKFNWMPCILSGNPRVVGILVIHWSIESCRQTSLEIEEEEAG